MASDDLSMAPDWFDVLLEGAERTGAQKKLSIRNLRHMADAVREALARVAVRRFPIMGGPSIPWKMIEPHEWQAKKNHSGQTLETLAKRGGLSPNEALAVLDDMRWRESSVKWGDEARDELERRRAAYEDAPAHPAPPTDAEMEALLEEGRKLGEKVREEREAMYAQPIPNIRLRSDAAPPTHLLECVECHGPYPMEAMSSTTPDGEGEPLCPTCTRRSSEATPPTEGDSASQWLKLAQGVVHHVTCEHFDAEPSEDCPACQLRELAMDLATFELNEILHPAPPTEGEVVDYAADLRNELIAAQARAEALEGAAAYAIGRLDHDSEGCPTDLPRALRELVDERAAWIEVAVEHNRACPQLQSADEASYADLRADGGLPEARAALAPQPEGREAGHEEHDAGRTDVRPVGWGSTSWGPR